MPLEYNHQEEDHDLNSRSLLIGDLVVNWTVMGHKTATSVQLSFKD